jgi:hypothetical protein
MLKLTNGSSIPYSSDLPIGDDGESDSSNDNIDSYVSAGNDKEPVEETLYEAEALINAVSGLSRRKGGCPSCTSRSRVIAIGKVHPLESGSLTFRNISGPGHYTIILRYMDCLSWSVCGDYWDRRWGLRLRVNDGDGTYVWLRKLGDLTAVSQFSMGIYLDQDNNTITLDNPEGDGPSMDSIILRKNTDQNVKMAHGAVWSLGFSSEDPIAGDHWILYSLRCIFDYMLDVTLLTCACTVIGVIAYFTIRFIRNNIHRLSYQPVDNSGAADFTLQRVSNSQLSLA